jgi:hypothetical protein
MHCPPPQLSANTNNPNTMTPPPESPPPPLPSRLVCTLVYLLVILGPWGVLWLLAKHFDLLPPQ